LKKAKCEEAAVSELDVHSDVDALSEPDQAETAPGEEHALKELAGHAVRGENLVFIFSM